MSRRKYVVKKFEPDNVQFQEGYLWDVAVQVKSNADGNYYYAGNGKYCKTLDDVRDFIKEWEDK